MGGNLGMGGSVALVIWRINVLVYLRDYMVLACGLSVGQIFIPVTVGH